jgi:hypothetical protein
MSVKVRFVRFRGLQDFPGCSSTEHIVAWDPAHPQQPKAFDIELDLETRQLRISVPRDQVVQKRVGHWIHPDTNRPNFGLGRVCYVPLEDVAKYELVEDAEEDAARAAKKAPAAPATSRAAPPNG